MGERRRLSLEDRREHVCQRGAVKWPFTRRHLVEHDPQTKDITSPIHLLPACLLRAHIRNRPQHCSRGGLHQGAEVTPHSLARWSIDLRQPEVQHLYLAAWRDHQIGWLEVAVGDSFAVRAI